MCHALPVIGTCERVQQVDSFREVNETQKIAEEDLCWFAAPVMMPLDQAVLYTTQLPGPLAPEVAAGPMIDVFAQPSLGTCMKSGIVHNSFFINAQFIYEP